MGNSNSGERTRCGSSQDVGDGSQAGATYHAQTQVECQIAFRVLVRSVFFQLPHNSPFFPLPPTFSFPLHLRPQVIWFNRKTLGFMLSSAEKPCRFMVDLCLLNIVSLQIRIWVLSNLTKGKSEFGYFPVQRKGSRVSPC